VTRGEFATILSRVLWGDKYEMLNYDYFAENHLIVLHYFEIIKNIDSPRDHELRSWVMLMLQRTEEILSSGKNQNTEDVKWNDWNSCYRYESDENYCIVYYNNGQVKRKRYMKENSTDTMKREQVVEYYED